MYRRFPFAVQPRLLRKHYSALHDVFRTDRVYRNYRESGNGSVVAAMVMAAERQFTFEPLLQRRAATTTDVFRNVQQFGKTGGDERGWPTCTSHLEANLTR